MNNTVAVFLNLLLYVFHALVGTYKVGTDLLVEFEFRTTRMNAVLLGISSQKMDGLGIELVDENVSEGVMQCRHHLLHFWISVVD